MYQKLGIAKMTNLFIEFQKYNRYICGAALFLFVFIGTTRIFIIYFDYFLKSLIIYQICILSEKNAKSQLYENIANTYQLWVYGMKYSYIYALGYNIYDNNPFN